MIAVLAAVYLTALLHSRRRIVFGILFGAAGVALGICVNILADGWNYHSYGHSWIFLPLWLRVTAFAILVISAGFGWCLSKQSLVPVTAIAVTAFVLPWAQRLDTRNGDSWQLTEPNLAAYALVAATCVFLTWWGVRENSKALVNYAIAAFAMTVMWFYFSSVMDKLGRSLGLIVLGILFLAGGWMLETMRRKLVRSIPEVAQ
jgi:quinol-cytochrome oxidoreductase complex cytochrome b subunit